MDSEQLIHPACNWVDRCHNPTKYVPSADTSKRRKGHPMYTKHTNPVALQSQQMISDALLRLMEREPFQSITITKICQEADIARKTFYRSFETKEDIIDYQLDQLYLDFEREMLIADHSKSLENFFAFKKKHSAYLILLRHQNLFHLYHQKFSAFMEKMTPIWSNNSVEQDYRKVYAIAGVIAITARWMQRDFAESVEEITAITRRARFDTTPLDKAEYSMKNPG